MITRYIWDKKDSSISEYTVVYICNKLLDDQVFLLIYNDKTEANVLEKLRNLTSIKEIHYDVTVKVAKKTELEYLREGIINYNKNNLITTIIIDNNNIDTINGA